MIRLTKLKIICHTVSWTHQTVSKHKADSIGDDYDDDDSNKHVNNHELGVLNDVGEHDRSDDDNIYIYLSGDADDVDDDDDDDG